MSLQNDVWTLKYAPTSIEEIILSDKNKAHFTALTDIPNNYLFLGKTGIGKSTLAKLLARKFAPNSYLYINASDENGIDTVRNKINGFISTVSFDGKQKVIILDECDGLSFAAQQALRPIMEEYLKDVKFILTGNYKHKLIEAIHSRCEAFDFDIDRKLVNKRIGFILKSEGISFDDDATKKGIGALIKQYYPDIRKVINELQKSCSSGKFVFADKQENVVAKGVFDKLKSKENPFAIREYTITNESEFNNDYHFLMRELFDLYVKESNSKGLLVVTEYMYRDAFVMDKEVNFSAMVFNLSQL
jgi:DNA polymerase III delta prime subunit